MALRMISNIHQMKDKNLKITRKETQKKDNLVQPTLFKKCKNVDKVFLNLLKKHFPASHILHKIFNKNTVKISYNCMKNISYVVSSHNKNILNPRTATFAIVGIKKVTP